MSILEHFAPTILLSPEFIHGWTYSPNVGDIDTDDDLAMFCAC